MATPIYKFWRARFTEAWYQLNQDEQKALLAKVDAARQQAGGTSLISCMSDWANEAWAGFGIEEFPDLAAVQQHTALLNELSWFRYIESEHLLGTRFPE